MRFNEYLKRCREKHGLTQERLVQDLYVFDEIFENLDIVTLSRWERGITQPGLDRQTRIILFFRRFEEAVFPCMEHLEDRSIEEDLCAVAIHNLIGKNRRLILNYPEGVVRYRDLITSHLRHADDPEHLLDISHRLICGMGADHVQMDREKLKALALYPGNLFLHTTFQDEFFGLLFTVRLTHEAFEELISLRKRPDEITLEDFADEHEKGCSYVYAFFAYDDKSATHLFLRYYAHLIANQSFYDTVGTITGSDDGGKLATRLFLRECCRKKEESGREVVSYRASLPDVLIKEDVVKMFFRHQTCPEEIG